MSTSQKTSQAARVVYSRRKAQSPLTYLNPFRLYTFFLNLIYILVQHVIIWLFKPRLPTWEQRGIKSRGRVAIIGAGLTGISSAAHAYSHGFDVVIFEASSKPGGIWANVNSTSGLQLNSLLYRFHPAVLWSRPFPKRDEILGEIKRVWKEYGLQDKTRFNMPVTSVRRAEEPDKDEEDDGDDADTEDEDGIQKPSKWIINDGAEGHFDALIVTVGTCGKPKMIKMEGMPSSSDSEDEGPEKKIKGNNNFHGMVLHSSELDTLQPDVLKDKKVVVIGGGASAVEAVETAIERGARTEIIVRSPKWIIPRNIIFDTAIAAQPFGREMPLSFIWEWYLKLFHYRDLKTLVPKGTGIFESTPIVNDEFLGYVRDGKCVYYDTNEGKVLRLTRDGVLIQVKGDSGHSEHEIHADIVVFATGFQKPSISFLPLDLFPRRYSRPNLYLQNFATEDWSVLMTNSSYVNAIGTVGHFHIGIYTRILLTFLLDPTARPVTQDMKLWVDTIRFVKRGARGGALGFFTYMELMIWLLGFLIIRPDRLRWMFFILNGWGVYP